MGNWSSNPTDEAARMMGREDSVWREASEAWLSMYQENEERVNSTSVLTEQPVASGCSVRGGIFALYRIEAMGFSTISPFMGPNAPSSSFFSRSGTLNLFNVATRSPTRASKSATDTPMPAWVAFMLRPV